MLQSLTIAMHDWVVCWSCRSNEWHMPIHVHVYITVTQVVLLLTATTYVALMDLSWSQLSGLQVAQILPQRLVDRRVNSEQEACQALLSHPVAIAGLG